MSEPFDELYQEIIRDRFKHPQYRAILNPDAPLFENPSCGDQVRLQIIHRDGHIEQARFEGEGCSISMASADMLCEVLEGKSLPEARTAIEEFLRVMRGELPPSTLDEKGDLAALKGVAQLPVRVKCATLAWNAAWQLLKNP